MNTSESVNATSADRQRASPSVPHERVLSDIGRPRVEACGAIGQIKPPAADELLVEALCTNRWRVFVERCEPAFERLGIVAAEGVYACKRESCGLRDVDEPCRRGEHAAGENILLDKVRLRSVALET